MARRLIDGTTREQVEIVRNPFQHRIGRKHFAACGGELDRQRYTSQTTTDFQHDCAVLGIDGKVALDRPGAGLEERAGRRTSELGNGAGGWEFQWRNRKLM